MNASASVVDVGPDWIVHVDVSGVLPESLDVRVRGSVLRVEGRRRVQVKRSASAEPEQLYGRFLRLVPLPAGYDGTRLDARVDRAWLEVRMSRAAVIGRGIW